MNRYLLRILFRKGPIEFPDQDYDGLKNYSLIFSPKNDTICSEPSSKISLIARVIIILIIIVLALTPIGQFIPGFGLWGSFVY